MAVAVSLQPFDYDPTDKNKHKFMVQSMFAPDGEYNQDQLVSSGLANSYYFLYKTSQKLNVWTLYMPCS